MNLTSDSKWCPTDDETDSLEENIHANNEAKERQFIVFENTLFFFTVINVVHVLLKTKQQRIEGHRNYASSYDKLAQSGHVQDHRLCQT